ncbi:MAG: CPBP family intramembrane metalloprotease [Clostridia bacterium]|nr:CPBP family intramembrane metalloprotease [Clostridia bacterium]
MAEKLFSWAPEWFVMSNTFEGSKTILFITWIMIMVFGNILAPAVEELYFRGYLLPRIAHLKGWAPVLNAVLFSAYHFWSPWEVITRAVAVLPVSYVAYKKQNIYIGMVAHITLNTLSSLPLLLVIFK